MTTGFLVFIAIIAGIFIGIGLSSIDKNDSIEESNDDLEEDKDGL